MVRWDKECVKCWEGKTEKLWELHSETEEENVENNPPFKLVPMGLPDAGLSSHCCRLNLRNSWLLTFSTLLLFHLSVLTQTMWPLTKPDTERLANLFFYPHWNLLPPIHVHLKAPILRRRIVCPKPRPSFHCAFKMFVRLSAVFPQVSNKTVWHVFTPSWKVEDSSVMFKTRFKEE